MLRYVRPCGRIYLGVMSRRVVASCSSGCGDDETGGRPFKVRRLADDADVAGAPVPAASFCFLRNLDLGGPAKHGGTATFPVYLAGSEVRIGVPNSTMKSTRKNAESAKLVIPLYKKLKGGAVLVSGFVPQGDITNAARHALQNGKPMVICDHCRQKVKRWYDRKASEPPAADAAARLPLSNAIDVAVATQVGVAPPAAASAAAAGAAVAMPGDVAKPLHGFSVKAELAAQNLLLGALLNAVSWAKFSGMREFAQLSSSGLSKSTFFRCLPAIADRFRTLWHDVRRLSFFMLQMLRKPLVASIDSTYNSKRGRFAVTDLVHVDSGLLLYMESASRGDSGDSAIALEHAQTRDCLAEFEAGFAELQGDEAARNMLELGRPLVVMDESKKNLKAGREVAPMTTAVLDLFHLLGKVDPDLKAAAAAAGMDSSLITHAMSWET